MKVMVIVKATKNSEAGVLPTPEMFTAMLAFNEQLVKAGVMLAGDGLHPTSKGARVTFNGKERTVVDGPFTETKEMIAGFWILQCRSKAEVIEWMRRCPNPYPYDGGSVDIRQIFEAEDFAPAGVAKA